MSMIFIGGGGSGGGGAGTPGEAFLTEEIACVAASALGDPVTATGLSAAPVGPVQVYIDSQWRNVSYGTDSGFIFFGPDAVTPRAQGAILTTDLPRLGDAAIAAGFTTDSSAILSATFFDA